MSIFFAKFGVKFLVIGNWLLVISQLNLIFTRIISDLEGNWRVITNN
jgi:hypothetical protein